MILLVVTLTFALATWVMVESVLLSYEATIFQHLVISAIYITDLIVALYYATREVPENDRAV